MRTFIIRCVSNSTIYPQKKVVGTLDDAKRAVEERWGDTYRGDVMCVETEAHELVAEKTIDERAWTNYTRP